MKDNLKRCEVAWAVLYPNGTWERSDRVVEMPNFFDERTYLLEKTADFLWVDEQWPGATMIALYSYDPNENGG